MVEPLPWLEIGLLPARFTERSCTSNATVAPPGILGGLPLAPNASSGGDVMRRIPPTCTGRDGASCHASQARGMPPVQAQGT